MQVLKFSAVTFQSADAERLAAFYRDMIGLPLRLELHGRMKPHNEGDLGDVHIAVLPAHPRAGSAVVPVFRVPDLGLAISELAAKSLEAAMGPLSIDAGVTVAGFHDPDGNMFRLIEFRETSPL